MDSTEAKDEVIRAKLRAIAEASRHNFPTADIEVMLEEIERGRGLDEPEGQEHEER